MQVRMLRPARNGRPGEGAQNLVLVLRPEASGLRQPGYSRSMKAKEIVPPGSQAPIRCTTLYNWRNGGQ